jgi:hypothetical protein
VAVYNPAGTQQTGAHEVIGTVVLPSNGNGSVTLVAPAAFTSATSYECTAAYTGGQTGTLVPTITSKTATGFTIKGDNSATLQFICTGN